MSYRSCAKEKPQCKGLKKGVKGYNACVRDAGCKAKSKKQPNKWQIHLAKFRKDNPFITGKDVMSMAKASYIK